MTVFVFVVRRSAYLRSWQFMKESAQVAEPKLLRGFSLCQSERLCLLSLDFGRQPAARVEVCACDEKLWMKYGGSGV